MLTEFNHPDEQTSGLSKLIFKWQIHGNRYQIYGTNTWYPVPGAGYLSPGTNTWSLALGNRYRGADTGHLVPDSRYLTKRSDDLITKRSAFRHTWA